jgi:dolichyl-phosphate-mannose--protein O-mannosyl transferase
MLITRTTFAYHYFPSILFLVLLLCYCMNDLMDRRPARWRWAVYGVTVGNTVLFAAFYPVLMGLFVPTWYTTNFLRWFPSWPF